MARIRTKLNLRWIANDKARRTTLKKRRAVLLKKAGELATLCNLDVAVVVYAEGKPEPAVWPPVPEEAKRVLERFKSLPELAQRKKMMDQVAFLRERIAGVQEQLRRFERDTSKLEAKLLLIDALEGRRPGLEGLTAEELASLTYTVEERLRGVRSRIERLLSPPESMVPLLGNGTGVGQGQASSIAPPLVNHLAEMDQQGWLMMDTVTPYNGGFGSYMDGWVHQGPSSSSFPPM